MPKINIFLDSSALFAGIVSASGAAWALLLLAETGHITVTSSEQVVAETERAIARKLPQLLSDVRGSTLASQAQIFRAPARPDIKANLYLLSHTADVSKLLAAMKAEVDYLATLNRRHFIDDPGVAQKSGLRIETPGDTLHWVGGQLSDRS